LFDPGCGEGGLFSENAGIDGDDPPTERNQTPPCDDFLGNPTDMRLGVVVLGREKEEADTEVSFAVKAVAKFFDFPLEHFKGNLGENTGAVSGFRIRIQSPAMGELADAAESPLQHSAGTFSSNIGHHTDPACVMLMGRVIKALCMGHIVVETEPSHGRITILNEGEGARVGILLRGKAFRGIVHYGT